MTAKEWESLCDGCGRCCLNKFEDEAGDIHYTDVACMLLDFDTCTCSNYANRTNLVPDCVVLKPKIMKTMTCLPKTCAYRRLYEGKDLAWWHHLRSGSRETVHEVGISVRGKVVSEVGMDDEEMEDHVVTWPTRAKVRPKR